MSRKKIFFAGPSVLPVEVLKEMQDQIFDYDNSGLSIIEASHRGGAFDKLYHDCLDLMRELFNSANLMLWSIGQLLEDGMSEDNFSRMFKGYDERWRQCIALKLKSLQQAKDTRQLEEELEMAKVNLGELELRRSIGDLLDGEYEAKAPAYRWEINCFEGEYERRKIEINFLEDLGNVAPREELGRLEANAKRFLERLDEEDKPEHSKKTYKKVKSSLEEILQNITSET